MTKQRETQGFFTRLVCCGSGQPSNEAGPDSDNAPLTKAQRYAMERQQSSHQAALKEQTPSHQKDLEMLYIQLRDYHDASAEMMNGIKALLSKGVANAYADNLKQNDNSLDSVEIIMKTALELSKQPIMSDADADSLRAGIKHFTATTKGIRTNHALPELVQVNFELISQSLIRFEQTHLKPLLVEKEAATPKNAEQEHKGDSPRPLLQPVASASSNMNSMAAADSQFHLQVTDHDHSPSSQRHNGDATKKPSFSEHGKSSPPSPLKRDLSHLINPSTGAMVRA